MSRIEAIAAELGNAINSEYQAETVDYIPNGGESVEVRAVVIRQPLESTTPSDQTTYPVEVLVPRSSIPSLDVGGDKFRFSERIGDSKKKTFTVVGLINEDGGSYWLALQ